MCFNYLSTRKENYIHLNCIGVTAEISETDILNLTALLDTIGFEVNQSFNMKWYFLGSIFLWI